MGHTANGGWRFWIDRGGTFTDIVAQDPANRLHVRKLLSENSARYADAGVAGIQQILADAESTGPIEEIRMGTTVATNALLERNGEPTLLVVNRGFEDALRIGDQSRPDIFALHIIQPEPAYGAVTGTAGRIAADGRELEPLATEQLDAALQAHFQAGYRAVAICFLHAWQNHAHEIAAGKLAARIGFEQISLSHEVSPLRQFVARGDTTVADAYLSPVLNRYIRRLQTMLSDAGLQPARLLFMQSNGGLVTAERFRGKDSVLSGPAGGVVGMVSTAADQAGQRLIGFDMGGTSTDVSLYAGQYEYVTDNQIAGIRLRSPMLRIHTVAAGGGSMLKFAAGRFQVGPESAGSHPGPAAYRNGGPLTVTDANLMLGRIVPEYFPRTFGEQGDEPLDTRCVQDKFAALSKQIATQTGQAKSPEAVAEGFLRIAVDNMANAIKRISIERGYDPTEFTLNCFGGAGGQLVCRVAEALGIKKILLHPLAGVLSAAGIGAAPLRAYRQQTVDRQLQQDALDALLPVTQQSLAACCRELLAQGCAENALDTRTLLFIGVQGADTALPIEFTTLDILTTKFTTLHAKRFGFAPETDAPLCIESFRVEVSGQLNANETAEALPQSIHSDPTPAQQTRLFCQGDWTDAVMQTRGSLLVGQRITGPAILLDTTTTLVIEPGWTLVLVEDGHCLLSREQVLATESINVSQPDPVLLEVFNSHFMNIAEQMGAVLENTAHSVNIRERLDFSCALFDHAGRLIANAPHIPVHLGSMGDSVAALLQSNAHDMQPGDVFMLNSPFHGGSHLPDVTVITPLFAADEKTIEFVVASRAHHADIGGITPGSMPPDSRTIQEEGILFEHFQLVANRRFCEAAVRTALSSGPWPARNPEQNIADLRAQIAANEKGLRELRAMLDHFGKAAVQAYMQHVRVNAENSVRAVISQIGAGAMQLELDNQAMIHVRVAIDPERCEAVVDFTGTSAQSASNFNAPASVTRAAVLYVFRTLITENIPLNDGCLTPIRVILPAGSLLNPQYPAAVVAGNVETSQCVTNALYGALGIMASSQCTMNNLTFGNARLQYYETICGGGGAGPTFAGSTGVHTQMTNSRMTDPEVMEARYPVLIREFSIRHHSGGAGRHQGGNGVIRHIEFLEPMTAAILSNNRRTAPFGLHGGQPGLPGVNRIMRRDGYCEPVDSVEELQMQVGDTLIIETPGGGGYGSTESGNIRTET